MAFLARPIRVHRAFALSVLSACLACAPPKPSAESSGENDASSTSGTDATTEVPTTTQTNAESETHAESSEPPDGNEAGTDCLFLPCFDIGPEDLCDLFDQNCPDGEKCVYIPEPVDGLDDFSCVPVLGAAQAGEACTLTEPGLGRDDCGQDSQCWNLGPDMTGTCHAFCVGTPDNPLCAMGELCAYEPPEQPGLCVNACEPLLQDCPEGQGCYWTAGFGCFATANPGGPGEPCTVLNDCAPGQLCSELTDDTCGGEPCCVPYCQLGGGEEACEQLPGSSCVAMFEPGQAPPGHELLGLCLL